MGARRVIWWTLAAFGVLGLALLLGLMPAGARSARGMTGGVLFLLIVLVSALGSQAGKRLAGDAVAISIMRRVILSVAAIFIAWFVFLAGVNVGREGPAAGAVQIPPAVAGMLVLVPGLVSLVGLAAGPWLLLVVRSRTQALTRERAARVRAEERATMAAHLHDSVLQMLTLIHKHADDAGKVTQFARHTERELRAWLYEPVDGDGGEDLAAALAQVVAGVEDRFGVTVELVTAGTCPVDESVRSVVGAAQEAMTNAALHAGVQRVSVFADVAEEGVMVRVRDRGRGFDRSRDAGPDRRGIRDSIVGRMQRHGGTASIHSVVGEGTEVELRLPLGGAP
jgi:signal transduction histidine kinase